MFSIQFMNLKVSGILICYLCTLNLLNLFTITKVTVHRIIDKMMKVTTLYFFCKSCCRGCPYTPKIQIGMSDTPTVLLYPVTYNSLSPLIRGVLLQHRMHGNRSPKNLVFSDISIMAIFEGDHPQRGR